MSTDVYKTLVAELRVERPLEETLSEISGIARRSIPGAEATSITLVRGDKAWTAAYSGQLAWDADEFQYRDGYGPCMDAGRTGLPMVVDDMRTEQRWPTYSTRVVQRGVLSSLSVPLPFQSTTIGALNTYSSKADAFGSAALELASEITTFIGMAVMNVEAQTQATSARQMHEALESRKVIDMALGILIATHQCTPDEAFALLSQTAQTQGRTLRDLASVLVDAEANPQEPSSSRTG